MLQTVQITSNEDQVRRCSGLNYEGLKQWRLDKGKVVQILAESAKPSRCGETKWRMGEVSHLSGCPVPCHTTHFICRHFLDMD